MAEATAVAEPETRFPDGIWNGTRIPIIGVAGEKGHGKTLFGLSIYPEETLVIDLEESSVSYTSLPLKKRWDYYTEACAKFKRPPKPIESFEMFRDLVDGIKPGDYKVLFVDPITDIEAGMVDWVREHPEEFGRTANQYAKATGLLWGDVKSYWKRMLGMLSTKVETFVFSAHMGAVWKGEKPTDRRSPKGKETLFELASLYLLVERKPDAKGVVPDKPTARVLKSRLAISSIDANGEIEHKPILPPRLEMATPAAIRKYIASPPDYSKLKKGERVEPDAPLTDDEKLAMQREIAEAQLETEQLKSGRLDSMKEAAQRQARQKEQQSAAAAEAQAKTDAKPEPSTESKPAEELVGKPASEPTPTPVEPDVYAKIEDLRSQLGITDAQWVNVLKKKGVQSTTDIPADDAEELRSKLWNKLTASDMQTQHAQEKLAAGKK